MNSITMDKRMVEIAMIFDQKPLDRRLTKLSEEHGELGEAILNNQTLEIVEESIDVLMVALSIFIDLGGQLSDVNDLINHTLDNPNYKFEDVYKNYIQLSVLNGFLSEGIQKYLGVATSIYKGKSTKEDLLYSIKEIMKQAILIMNIYSNNKEHIIEIINKKNSKWKKNAMKGFILSQQNQCIINNDKEFLYELSEFSKNLTKDYPVNVKVLSYDSSSSIIEAENILNDELRNIFIFYNVPFSEIDSLSKLNTPFKMVLIS